LPPAIEKTTTPEKKTGCLGSGQEGLITSHPSKKTIPSKSIVITWFKRRGNPIDWPETEKAIFACLIQIMLYLFFFFLASVLGLLPSLHEKQNTAIGQLVAQLSLIFIVLTSALLLFSLHIRQKNPASTLPSTILIYTIGQPLMVFAVLNGIPVIITGLLLAGLPVFGLVLFNSRHVFIAASMIWIEIIVLGAAVSSGLLPDAPLFIKSTTAPVFTFGWFAVQVLIGLPVIVLVLLITSALLQGLRSREEKILELSRRDGLTGIWNRRYLTEMLEHELAVAKRSNSPLSVIMIDLDFFKKINDQYGHPAGDAVLVAAATTLQQAIRETDYVGRFGGEEFVIVLPACEADMAMTIAERCRAMMAALAIMADDVTIAVSASFGVSTTPPNLAKTAHGQGGNLALLNIADKALYKAKAEGRNRVIFMAAHEN
jgi:diguanylate cyclase (GGDEF)-like protein